MFLEPYKELFTTCLGKLEGVTAKMYVDKTVHPRYCKPRPVPLAIRAKVESELDRLQEEGVIRPVEFSKWAAPIVPVLKASGDIRLCGDYKVTINKAVKVDKTNRSLIHWVHPTGRNPTPLGWSRSVCITQCAP